MDTQIPENLNAGSSFTVDASQPFRSVKEAVAMFGERLLFRDIQASPKHAIENAASISSELPLCPDSYPDAVAKEGEGLDASFVNELSHSLELTQTPCTPPQPAGNEFMESELIQCPSTNVKIADKQVDLYFNKLSRSSDISVSLVRHPDIAVEHNVDSRSPSNEGSTLLNHSQCQEDSPSSTIKHIVESPMFDLTPSLQFPKNKNHGNIVHGNDLVMMLMILKKLEAELQETKKELNLLKQRESETEVALASLNAELHKNMSKMAKAEAAEAAKAAARSIQSIEERNREAQMKTEETIRGDIIVKTMDSPTLSQILSITDYGYFGANKKANKVMKKKPIVPLVTDLIPWRKKSSPTNDLPGPLYTSRMYFS